MVNPAEHPTFSDNEIEMLLDVASQVGGVQQPFSVLWKQNPGAEDSGCLTIGWPEDAYSRHTAALSDRLVWWPNGLCTLRRVGIISSRVSARKDLLTWWYDLLRTAVLRVCPEKECVMCVEGTTTHEALVRSSELFGIPRLDLLVDDVTVSRQQLADWLRTRLRSRTESGQSDLPVWTAEVLPQIDNADAAVPASLPLRDRLNLQLSHRIYVLSCRDGGHIHCLLKGLLADESPVRPLVFLADGLRSHGETRQELLELRAVAWLVDSVTPDESLESVSRHSTGSGTSGPIANPEEWLCHWTRPCTGEWPGQSRTDYLDELILGCATRDRSALASLLRIVSHREILASHIRDAAYVVSFTEVPLLQFRSRRVYRRHRRRHDFEPFGIAVRRDVLKKLGARPVTYGPATRKDALTSDDAVWHQPAKDHSGKIDWRAEREWRLPANLRLDELPAQSVCVFVNSPDEVEVVRSVCDWPVVAIPMPPKKNDLPP